VFWRLLLLLLRVLIQRLLLLLPLLWLAEMLACGEEQQMKSLTLTPEEMRTVKADPRWKNETNPDPARGSRKTHNANYQLQYEHRQLP
jgi:hypothetical protein